MNPTHVPTATTTTHARYNLTLVVHAPSGSRTTLCVKADAHSAALGSDKDACSLPTHLEDAPARERIAPQHARFSRFSPGSSWKLGCLARRGKVHVLGERPSELKFGADLIAVWHGMRFALLLADDSLPACSEYEVHLTRELVQIEHPPEPPLCIKGFASLPPEQREKRFEALIAGPRRKWEEETYVSRPVWELVPFAHEP